METNTRRSIPKNYCERCGALLRQGQTDCPECALKERQPISPEALAKMKKSSEIYGDTLDSPEYYLKSLFFMFVLGLIIITFLML